MNFYLHYLGDYARDTKGLSMIEHGAYRVLLDHTYATEQPIPNELKELYRIAGAQTPAERKAVDKVADKFFPVNGDGRRHNRRAEAEIVKAKGKSAKAKGSAAARWQGERTASANADSMRTHSDGNANQNQKPEESKTSPATAGEARGAAADLPDCPHEKLIALYHELLPDSPRVEKWTPARQQAMRARWRDEAKPNREKHRGYRTVEDGLAYWRRFFGYAGESKFLTGRAPGRDGKPPFVATLAWLVKAENFAKVIESTYHRDF